MPRRKAQSIQSAVVECVQPPLTDSISSNDLSLPIRAKRSTVKSGTCQSATFCPQSVFSSRRHGQEEKEKHQTSQMPPRRCRTLVSLRSFVQAMLARSLARCHYARPENDCQPNSVSQYVPVVIRVDGLINKGKLQERKQTSTPPHQKHLRPTKLAGKQRRFWKQLSCM